VSTCATCRHWTRSDIEPQEGICRGAPPSVVLVDQRLLTAYPVNAEYETCGAYSPRVPTADPAPQEERE